MSRRLNRFTRTVYNFLVPAGVSPAVVRRWTSGARWRLGLTGRIAVTIVPPAISQQWNKRYRRRARPTNVLSFDYVHDRPRGAARHILDGEVLLCPVVIRREARQQGQTYRARLKMLLAHGLIHLRGLDHQTSADQRRWARFERRLS